MRVVAAVLLGLTSLVLFASPAAACSCESPSLEEAFDRSGAVFVATVTTAPVFDGGSSSAAGLWLFDVERVYKGHVSERQGVVTPLAGASCGFELAEGQRVLVFAGGHEDWLPRVDGATFYGNLCNGTTVLDGAVPASFGRGLLPAPGADVPAGGDERILEVAAAALMGVAVTGLFAVARGRARIAACPPSAPPSSLRS